MKSRTIRVETAAVSFPSFENDLIADETEKAFKLGTSVLYFLYESNKKEIY